MALVFVGGHEIGSLRSILRLRSAHKVRLKFFNNVLLPLLEPPRIARTTSPHWTWKLMFWRMTFPVITRFEVAQPK